MARSLLSLLLLLLAAVAHAATSPSEFRPLKPPSYPLAVRSPFLNAWLPAGSESGLLPESSAVWWDGTPVTWGTSVQIDGALYSVFGQLVHDMAVQTEAKYTATHSLFKLNAGGVNITADFFSPVSPNNHIRHSLPFSYYTLAFESADGKPHDVKVFNEFGFNWAGQNNSLVCNYFSDQNDTIGYFTINTQEDIPFTVSKSNSDGSMATWGHAVFSTTLVKGLTVQSGPQNAVRAEFNSTGALNGTVFQSGDGRSITAFAHDLGSIQGQTNVTLAVGHVRDKAINYMGQIRTPYYRSAYPTLPSALSHFFEDYASALNESFTF